MSDAFIIREAGPADAAAYREIRLEGLRLHPEAFGSDYEETLARPDAFWVDRVSYASGRAKDNMWLACASDGALVGTLAVFTEKMRKLEHVGNVVGVYTRPDWRKRGVAGALLETALAWARRVGFRRLRLAVAVNNAPAIAAYTRAGFVAYGHEPEVIHTGGVYYDEILMTRLVQI